MLRRHQAGGANLAGTLSCQPYAISCKEQAEQIGIQYIGTWQLNSVVAAACKPSQPWHEEPHSSNAPVIASLRFTWKAPVVVETLSCGCSLADEPFYPRCRSCVAGRTTGADNSSCCLQRLCRSCAVWSLLRSRLSGRQSGALAKLSQHLNSRALCHREDVDDDDVEYSIQLRVIRQNPALQRHTVSRLIRCPPLA